MHARFIGNCLLGYWVTLHPTLGQLTPVFFLFLPSCQRFITKKFQIKNFYPPIAILCDLHLHQLFIVCITLFFFSYFWLCSYSHRRQHLLPYPLCYVMAVVIPRWCGPEQIHVVKPSKAVKYPSCCHEITGFTRQAQDKAGLFCCRLLSMQTPALMDTAESRSCLWHLVQLEFKLSWMHWCS